MSKNIQHTGIIEKIEPPIVFVQIVQQSACSECHAKSLCMASDSKIKTIEVEDHTGTFQINEKVLICGQYAMGMQAVSLAFIIPLILIVIFITIGTFVFENEIIGGLTGLFILLPYYSIIYLMRDKLKKRFVFTLSKIN